MKILSHRLYTELLTALSTANKDAAEASLLVRQVKEGSATFEKRVLDLEESHRRLKTEWLDFYDKTHRAMQRIVKRAERADVIDPPDTVGEIPAAQPGGDAERFVDPISKRIKAMRQFGRS